MTTSTAEPIKARRAPASASLPVWRIGIAAGLTVILCCVWPTVLALLIVAEKRCD